MKIGRIAIFALTVMLAGGLTFGQTIRPIWPGRAPGAMGEADRDIPTLAIHLPEKPTGIGVLVCPGGGYGGHAMGHEGTEVAKWLNDRGIAAFILKYRLAPYKHPIPSSDAQRAMRTIRANAEQWRVDPKKIGIMGFSAGGHLASTVATHFDAGDAKAADLIERQSCRPDFAILVYPVISMERPVTHDGSRNNLLGANPDPKLVEGLSNHKQVTAKTPPTFLVHSKTDKVVPVENSVLFHEACRKNGVPSEAVIFETGWHGYGLAPKNPELNWTDHCIKWVQQQTDTVQEGK